jgi:lipid-A-disaccharide synthase-like uncharacterized protein
VRILGIISIGFFTFSFIPQIITTLKTKNVVGISVWLWVMITAGHVAGLIYVFSLREPLLIGSYAIGLMLSLLTLGITVRYKKSNGLKRKIS